MNFILNPENARSRMKAAWDICTEILQHGQKVKVSVSPFMATRSDEQNDKMWAMLTDISKQVEWFVDGEMQNLSPEEFKHIFTAGLVKHQRIAKGIDGGFVILGTRTSKLKVGEMADLISLIHAFGDERWVIWGDNET